MIINRSNVKNIGGNNYDVWMYNNESTNNGGEYFQEVLGYEGGNNYQDLKNLNQMNTDYSF